MESGNQIGAVVDRDMRFNLERIVYVPVVPAIILASYREHGNSIINDQRGRDIILRRKRI
jgi:hypothetical protein